MKQRFVQLVLLLALAMLAWGAAGCVGIQSDPESNLPNNAPAEWEGKMLGVPL
ncbi:MAG: hypothetical protein MJ202_01265 [Lentisphaeria bacterium]|nr:hypothetical protein [Lentisphaeria bacterium]